MVGIQFQCLFQEPDALFHRLAGGVPGAHSHGIGPVFGLASLLEYESRHAVVEVGFGGVESQGLAQLGFGVGVLIELQQRHAVQMPVVGVLTVLTHGFLSRQHGQQILLPLIPLFCLQIIRRLALELARPEKENGKRREGQKPDRATTGGPPGPARSHSRRSARPARLADGVDPSFLVVRGRIHETVF